MSNSAAKAMRGGPGTDDQPLANYISPSQDMLTRDTLLLGGRCLQRYEGGELRIK